MTYRKKLIEVALPLEAINREASHARNPSGTGTRPRCTSGGHDDHWRRVGRCCSLHWLMTLLAGLKIFRLRRIKIVNENVCSILSKNWSSGRM